MRRKIEYIGIQALLSASRLMPKSLLYALSTQVVRRSYAPESRRRRRVLKHLQSAFPDRSGKELEAIAEEFMRQKAQFYVEILLMLTDRFDYEGAVENLAEARERIEALKARNERGMVFLVSHYGNWEFLAQFFALGGLPGTLVAKEQRRNPLIDEKIIQPYRRRFGHRVIERKGALRSIARILKNKEGVGMHIDQMIPPPNGVAIDFFGRPAYASKSMAQLKLRFDPLIVPIFAVRRGRERFRIEILDPVEYTAPEAKEPEEKIRRMTRRYSEILEEQIRKEPAQWEWNYQRWRGTEEIVNSEE